MEEEKVKEEKADHPFKFAVLIVIQGRASFEKMDIREIIIFCLAQLLNLTVLNLTKNYSCDNMGGLKVNLI